MHQLKIKNNKQVVSNKFFALNSSIVLLKDCIKKANNHKLRNLAFNIKNIFNFF